MGDGDTDKRGPADSEGVAFLLDQDGDEPGGGDGNRQDYGNGEQAPGQRHPGRAQEDQQQAEGQKLTGGDEKP